MSNLKLVKPSTDAEKTTHTTMDVHEVTPNIVKSWKLPPFQRPLKVNAKVEAIAKEIASDGGVIPGVITLGILGNERYIIDGQHRREAFVMSGCAIGYVDIRVAHYKTMADMAEEFHKLNSRIVQMKPDDYLRALELDPSTPGIGRLRKACPFVGYDMIRRGENSPLLSMGTTIRCWDMSSKEVPISGGGAAAGGIVEIAKHFVESDVPLLASFLNTAHSAWGSDREYHRLWSNLNLTICMWLYRRLVVTGYSATSVRITISLFQKCLTALSSDESYVEWLRGKNTGETHRAPAYRRIKECFSKRIAEEQGGKPKLPQPSWASH